MGFARSQKLPLVHVHPEDRKAFSPHPFYQPLKARHLLDTGCAPVRPEVHQDHLAPELVEAAIMAVQIGQEEVDPR